jgi:hypothetical protein
MEAMRVGEIWKEVESEEVESEEPCVDYPSEICYHGPRTIKLVSYNVNT